MKQYAIGDVHGEYDTLAKLVGRLPKGAKLFFVGDLIDRGPKSAKVVEFVRKGNHGCVLGNHEDMMIEQGKIMKKERADYEIDGLWAVNGGLDTLLSYGIIELIDDYSYRYTRDEKSIDKFIEDAEWMEKLPLMIGIKSRDGKDIVVSHSSMIKKWRAYYHRGIKSAGEDYEALKNYVVWNRDLCGITTSFGATEYRIVNVYGHTPHEEIDTHHECINIDTGCTYDRAGLGYLTALDLQDLKLIRQKRAA